MAIKQRIIKPYTGFQESFVRSNLDFVVGGGAMSGGKMCPLDTPVLTPHGWRENGSLQIGDYVSTPFGMPSRILGIFDHKNKDIYEVVTEDGRRCECGLEHLWSYKTRGDVFSEDVLVGLATDDTKALMSMMGNGDEIYIPISKAVMYSSKTYVIAPYLLGEFLLCGGLEHFMGYLSKMERKQIISLGIDTSMERLHIPESYLYGSISQRTDLLIGMIDNGGFLDSQNHPHLCVKSPKLCDDIVYLCRSLGYIAYADMSDGSYHIDIETHDKLFSESNLMSQFVKNESNKGYTELPNRYFVKISSIKKTRKSDARCIFIEDPLHLYVIKDFIGTHNTAAAVLTVAEPIADPKFRAVFLRNNLGDLKSGGGILDEFKNMYGSYCSVVESGDPHVDFPSGARIDVTHIADQSKDKVMQRFKGRQYDFIYFDEGTGFTWDCFRMVYSRNRGKAAWTGKVRMTTNPKRNHWLRRFLDWYIGLDGYIIPERNGVVRYFFINGETVSDVVWGDTKEEVYQKCRITIDRILQRLNSGNGKSTYKDMIKSFTFYEGKISSNKSIMESNSNYVGSVAVMGGRESQANLEGNWNVDTDEENDQIITGEEAENVFLNEEQRNNDKWITADLADIGTDNFLALAWDGFHIEDYLILTKSTPKDNAEYLSMFAKDHDVADSHIIYDGIRGTYINDYIEDAIPFFSYYAAQGVYARSAYNLKTECYMRVINAIKKRYLSIDEEIGEKIYEHQNLTQPITFREEFREECSVIRFIDMPNGRKSLMSKKAMNKKLGKSRSMDLLDPIAMRFFPVLNLPYGEELAKTSCVIEDVSQDGDVNIYDETLYG